MKPTWKKPPQVYGLGVLFERLREATRSFVQCRQRTPRPCHTRFSLGLEIECPIAKERHLGIARDKSFQLPGFVVTLQAIDEIDLDLRVRKFGFADARAGAENAKIAAYVPRCSGGRRCFSSPRQRP